MTEATAQVNRTRYVRLTIVLSIALGILAMWALPPDLYFRWDRFLSGTPQPYFGFSADRYLEGAEPRSGWAIAGFLIAKFAIGVATVWLAYLITDYVINGAKPGLVIRSPGYARWSIIGIVLIAVGVYGVLLADDYRGFRQNARQFCRVHLTDTRADVLYNLGRPNAVQEEPPPSSKESKHPFDRVAFLYYVDGPSGDSNTMPAAKTIEDYFTWQWSVDKSEHSYIAVTFDKNGVVGSILAYDDRPGVTAWGPLAGIHDGASEDSILALGKPTSSTIDGATKKIEFDDIGVRFYLGRQRAYSAELRPAKGGELALLKRFLHTLLP